MLALKKRRKHHWHALKYLKLNFWCVCYFVKVEVVVLTQVTPITVVSPSGVARATNQQPHSKFVRSRSANAQVRKTLKMHRGTHVNLKPRHQDFNENPFPWDLLRLKVSRKVPRLEIQCTTGVCDQLSMSPVIHAECSYMCLYVFHVDLCRDKDNLLLTSLVQKKLLSKAPLIPSCTWPQSPVCPDLLLFCTLGFVCIYSRISMFHMSLNCLDRLWFTSWMKFQQIQRIF